MEHCRWLKPRFVASIEFLEWTRENGSAPEILWHCVTIEKRSEWSSKNSNICLEAAARFQSSPNWVRQEFDQRLGGRITELWHQD
jgi:hypothetical protein